MHVDIALNQGLKVYVPTSAMIKEWINSVLREISYKKAAQVSVRVVEEQEITELNNKYRHINKTTNVLSFPFEPLSGVDVPLLGDLVICATVVEQEAALQAKTCAQHWAHMVVHGTLHLLGYDHINENDAEEMESLEIKIISNLGFPNPYGEITTP